MKTWIKISGLGLLAALMLALGLKRGFFKLNKKGTNVFNH